MYVIYRGRYTGTAGDSLRYNKGMKFTTLDRDNDLKSGLGNCALSCMDGWWYKNCAQANLNGEHVYGGSDWRLVIWYGFKGTKSLQTVEMKLQ